MKTKEKQYRWKNAHEWLEWAIKNKYVGTEGLVEIIKTFVNETDVIDSLFFVAEDTGYFDPVD